MSLMIFLLKSLTFLKKIPLIFSIPVSKDKFRRSFKLCYLYHDIFLIDNSSCISFSRYEGNVPGDDRLQPLLPGDDRLQPLLSVWWRISHWLSCPHLYVEWILCTRGWYHAGYSLHRTHPPLYLRQLTRYTGYPQAQS